MHTALSSYALEGIEAVPVDVVVDGDRVKVVEPTTGRCVLSVRQPGPDPETRPTGSGVQVPLRKRAPERLTARKFHPASPICPFPQSQGTRNRTPERARADMWESWGSNPLGPPGRESIHIPTLSRPVCFCPCGAASRSQTRWREGSYFCINDPFPIEIPVQRLAFFRVSFRPLPILSLFHIFSPISNHIPPGVLLGLR